MPISALRGSGLGLPVLPAFGADVNSSNVSQLTNILTNRYGVPAGTNYTLNAGNFLVGLGLYTAIECLDPITGTWFNTGNAPGQLHMINSDGTNVRIVNNTGCPIGARITNAGSGYTNGIFLNGTSASGVAGLAVSSSITGGSVWTCIVGGAVSTSVTTTSGGTGYLYPPQVIIQAPPAGGLPATGHTTLSGGVATLVIDNQGAGYLTAPVVVIVNDPRDTAGSGAIFVLSLTGSGTLTGMYATNYGAPQTSVPSITFSGGGGTSAAATAIMNFTVTSYAVSTAGTTYTGNPMITTGVNLIAAQTTTTNPLYTTGITFVRPARIEAVLSAGTAGIISNGQIVEDGGFGIQVVPEIIIQTNGTNPTIANAAALTAQVGGTNDTVFIASI